ncbi:MAG: hypothetical protein KDG57_21600, partial [Rhodoferax sp.]|nr:hypothetical protein [Rhodoferax sp.]
DLSVPQILSAAGLDAATAPLVSIEINQEGGACASLLDEDKQVLTAPVKLFQLDLALVRGTHWRGTIRLSDTLTVAESALLGFATVQGGDGSIFCDADTCLSVNQQRRMNMDLLTLEVETVDELVPGGRTALRIVGRNQPFGQADALGSSTQQQRLSDTCERERNVQEQTFFSLAGSDVTLNLELASNGRMRLLVGETRHRFSGPRTARATVRTQIPGNGGVCDDRPHEFETTELLSDAPAVALSLPTRDLDLQALAEDTRLVEGSNLVDGLPEAVPPAEADEVCLRTRQAMPFATLEHFFPTSRATDLADPQCTVSRFVGWRLERQ